MGGTISMTGQFPPGVSPFRAMMENWAAMVNAEGGIPQREYGKALPLKFIIYATALDLRHHAGGQSGLLRELLLEQAAFLSQRLDAGTQGVHSTQYRPTRAAVSKPFFV